MDRPDDVGVPALEAAHGQWPEGTKVDHFMTGGIGVREHAGEALVAGSELVELVARDGGEGPPRPEDGLTRTRTRQDEDVESALPAEGRHLVRHCSDVENADVVRPADHVVVA